MARKGPAGRLDVHRHPDLPGRHLVQVVDEGRPGLARERRPGGCAGSAAPGPGARRPRPTRRRAGSRSRRCVIAGRAHSMSATVPSPSSETPSSTPASSRNRSDGYGPPGPDPGAGRPWTVVLPRASRSVASIATSAARASGAAPPQMPEWTPATSASTVTTTSTFPRRLTVTPGRPTAALPVSATRWRRPGGASAWDGTNASSPPVPCSSDPSTTSFRSTGTSSPSARRAVRCDDDVALAVGRAAAVPAAADLGEAERRGPPGRLVERRLDVVVGVQQHGRGVRVAARPRPDDRALPSGVSTSRRRRTHAGEPVGHPLARRARTRRAGTGGGRRPTGWRRARTAPRAPAASAPPTRRAGARPRSWHRGRLTQGPTGSNGWMSWRPRRTSAHDPSGTSFQAPGRSRSGSETMKRVSSPRRSEDVQLRDTAGAPARRRSSSRASSWPSRWSSGTPRSTRRRSSPRSCAPGTRRRDAGRRPRRSRPRGRPRWVGRRSGRR